MVAVVVPGNSMWSWRSPSLLLLLLLGLASSLGRSASANPGSSSKYGGDVNGEEVVIDQLEEYLRSQQHRLHGPRHHLQQQQQQQEPAPRRLPQPHQDILNQKIEFGVGPNDPRFFLPSGYQPPAEDSLLPLLPSNLRQQHPRQQEYPGDLLQYPEEEIQYPGQDEVDARYPSAQYMQLPDLQYPGAELYPDRPLLQEDVRGMNGWDNEQDAARMEENKRMLEDDKQEPQEVVKEKQATEEKKNDDSPAVATSQPERVHYMHLQRAGHEASLPEVRAVHADQPGGKDSPARLSDVYFIALVAGCTAAAVCVVISAGICWYRLNKSHRAAQDAEYPAYGVTGPNKDLSPSSGDRKLAQSAHMYHYQHQKQQMISLEKSSGGERHGSASDVDSEEEGEENEHTVYECPGLAPTGEMEVKNPLFHDDPTPATPSLRRDADTDDDEDDDEDEEEEINTTAK